MSIAKLITSIHSDFLLQSVVSPEDMEKQASFILTRKVCSAVRHD